MADINIKFEDRINKTQSFLYINPSTVTPYSNDIALSLMRSLKNLLSSGEVQFSSELDCAMFDLTESWNDLEGGFVPGVEGRV